MIVVVAASCTFESGAAGPDVDGGSGSAGSDTSEGGPGTTSVASGGGTGATSTGASTPTSTSTSTSTSPSTSTSANETTPGGRTDTSTSTSPGDSSESGATTGGIGCTEVLYVAGAALIGEHDQPFYDVLVALGTSVKIVQADISSTADADSVCLVVVSASSAGSDVADKFRDVPVPVVTWEYAIYDDMNMTGDVFDTDFGPADPQEDIEITDGGHPLAAGLSGTLTVLAPAPGRMSWGVPGPAADVVATLPGDAGRATLFGYGAGDMMVGLTAPAARVGFPALTSGPGTTINADGQALFEAALLWAAP